MLNLTEFKAFRAKVYQMNVDKYGIYVDDSVNDEKWFNMMNSITSGVDGVSLADI